MFAAARKRPASALSMQAGGRDKPINVELFKKSVCEAWFASPTVFAMKALNTPLLLPDGFTDSALLRGVLVCQALQLFPTVSKCPNNRRHPVSLAFSEGEDRYRWRCGVFGSKCYRASLCPVGILSHVRMGSWLHFLHFVNGLRLNVRWTKLATDIEAVYGAHTPTTLRCWRKLYQDALELYLKKHGHLVLGSASGDVVVFDETSLGNCGGISKAASSKETHHASNKVQRDRVAKRLPARTLHRPAASYKRPAVAYKRPAAAYKRPSSVMKSVYNKGRAGTAQDQRTGRWLFAAVLVGNKSTRYTHGNGKKRFSFHMMNLPDKAADGKPRGIKEMKKAIQKCIHHKAMVVHDKWKASGPAVQQLGLKSAPPVNHTQGWRDRSTGFHSNDIESEFSRLKRHVRERYGRLSFQAHAGSHERDEGDDIDAGDLYEYTFYMNVGNGFHDVLKALQLKSPC